MYHNFYHFLINNSVSKKKLSLYNSNLVIQSLQCIVQFIFPFFNFRTMRNLLFISGIFLIFLNITAGASDSCPKLCDESKCEEPVITCDSGIFLKDDCDCCDVCQRSRNQICGGLHARFGKCEPGLECVSDNSEAFMNYEDNDVEEEEDDVIGVCQG